MLEARGDACARRPEAFSTRCEPPARIGTYLDQLEADCERHPPYGHLVLGASTVAVPVG